MVHVTTPKPSLGSALGQALGGVGGAYAGNKLRQSMLHGEQQYQNQLQQQQRQQQASTLAEALNQANQVYMNPNLSPQQKQFGLYQVLSSNPEVAQTLIKSLQGQEELGLKQQQLGQKQQQLGRQEELLNQLFGGGSQQPQMAESQTKEGFDVKAIPDEQIAKITALNPQLGRLLQQQKDVSLREARAQEELALQKKKASPEFVRGQEEAKAQTQADVKYNKELQEASKQHELKEKTLDRLEKLNTQGVTGKPYEKLLEKSGLVALTSEGRREFAAEVKNLITDIRSILGSQFTGFEFQTILNAYPSADFSKEANNAIIKNLKEFQDIKKKEVEFAKELKKQNGGRIPEDFQAKVNEKVHEYALTKAPEIKENTRKIMAEEYGVTPGNILMFTPDGDPLDVNPKEVEKYRSLGATLP